jgi:hypothetical protein
MTVYFNQTLDIPYAGMILRRNPVNISILAGNDDIVLVLYDPSGSQYDFSIAAGQKILQRNFDLFRFEITGSGQAAVAISYPEVIEPSIEITLNPNLPQSVSSPQLPSSLDSNGFFKTRYLGGSDVPGRGWTLGSGDTPNRSWALGSGDVPNRSWNLGSTDNPDVTANQADPLGNLPNLGGVFVTGNISASLPLYAGSYMRITFTVPAYGHLNIKRITWQTDVWNLSNNVIFQDSLQVLSTYSIPYGQLISIPNSTSFMFDNSFIHVLLNNDTGAADELSLQGWNPTYIVVTPDIHYYNDSSSSSTFWIQLYVNSGTGTTDEATGALNISGHATGGITWQQSNYNASSGNTGTGSSGTGGCWSADSWFYTSGGKAKQWKEFKVGDYILTIHGYEKIEAIYDMGMQETFEIDDSLWITDSQPFRISELGPEQTLKERPSFATTSKLQPTYDCKVKSLWLIPLSPRIHALKDVSKKI